MTKEPLALAAGAPQPKVQGQEDKEEGAEAPAPSSVAFPPARFAHLLRAVVASSATEEAGVGVVKRLLTSHPTVVGRLLQLEEEEGAKEEGEVSLWEAVETAALLPFHLLFQDNPPPPTTTMTPSLLTALSLPALIPSLCPPSRRGEALPRLVALGLRCLIDW